MMIKNRQDAIDYVVATARTISERIQTSPYMTKLTDVFCVLSTSLADNPLCDVTIAKSGLYDGQLPRPKGRSLRRNPKS